MSWRVRKIDEESWLPTDTISGVDSVTIKRATGDDAQLIESGDMSYSGNLSEGWYRIEAMGEYGASSAVEPIATLLFACDGSEWNHGTWGGSMTGSSVLTYASEKRFKSGEYAPKGADGALYAAELLRKCIPAPIEVEGSFTLSDHVVFDLGSSIIDGVWAILETAGWCMQIAGDGTVTIMQKPTGYSLELTTETRGIVMPNLSTSLPISNVPNVVKVYDGEQSAEAVNDDPSSQTSTVSRGREIESVEENPVRVDGETLAAYARRRLIELSDIYETIDIEREYVSGVLPYSAVRVSFAEAEIDDDYMVMSQTIECSHGIKVGETLGRKSGWQG